MLWYKAWLETRWRALMPLVMILFVIVQIRLGPGKIHSRPDQAPGAIFLLFAPLMLAGSGIKTEPVFQPIKGLHGSMYFTLSLPVSRRRLLGVRTGVGMLETAAIIVLGCVAGGMFPELRGDASLADGLKYAVTVLLCCTGFYGLSTLLATFLDQVWQVWGSFAAVFLTRWLFSTIALPQSLDVFRAMGDSSPLITHMLPWAAMGVSLGAGALFFLAALRVVQTREY